MDASITKTEKPEIQSESGKLLRLAIEKDLDIDKLKTLMDLRDRDERFRAEREFEEHFAAMQKDYIPAFKTKAVKTNAGKTAYSYCPLPQILAVYAPILARHGFSYRWEEVEIEGKEEKKTTCFLSGYGFSRQASISLPYGDINLLINPIQARGATSEYGRRYTFMNVTGCIVADDTDSDGRLEPTERHEETPSTSVPASITITVLDEPVPEDYKDKKAEYRSKGYGCKQIGGVWKWVRYGAATNATGAKPAVMQPQAKPATATPEPEVTKPGKLKPKTESQLLDMMNEMGFNAVIQKSRMQWASEISDAKALEWAGAEYKKFSDTQKASK